MAERKINYEQMLEESERDDMYRGARKERRHKDFNKENRRERTDKRDKKRR